MSADCAHERSHIVDSVPHGRGFAVAASRRIFCDRCRLQRWLDVEAALALAQAEVGLIPEAAAAEIARAARLDRLDLEDIVESHAQTSHSLVPLVRALQSACAGGAGELVHYGATTQDIQDTAQVLEMREVLDEVERRVARIVQRLASIAVAHRASLMVGRTHSIPALPITFGLKVASWIDELSRHAERIAQARPRLLVVQLFGGVGSMAAFGPRALEVAEAFARRLSLGCPSLGWHASRDRIAEYVVLLASLAATQARIADELRTLSRPEIGELSLVASESRISSSTMPHKRNPDDCEQIVALARLARAQVQLVMEGMVVEHERDFRGTRTEWCAVPDASHYTVAALHFLEAELAHVDVRPEIMAAHAHACRDALCAEALTFEMGRRMGKDAAFRRILELSNQSHQGGTPLHALLLQAEDVLAAVGGEANLHRILDPGGYLGATDALITRVLAKV